MSEAFPGSSGGKLPRRGKPEEWSKKEEEEEEVRRVEKEVMDASLTTGPIEHVARDDVATAVEGDVPAATSRRGPFQHGGKVWIVHKIEERGAMDRFADDEKN